MKDQIVFAVLPYAAVLVALAGIGCRAAGWLERDRPEPGERRRLPGAGARRIGLAGVLLGHAVALAFPGAIVEWTRHPARLLILEGIGLAFAGLALVGVGLGVAFGLRAAQGNGRSCDVLCATLLGVALLSGIGVALAHRWSSTWHAATLVPYLRSLAALQPRLELAVLMPFLVRFHVLSGFALLAFAPFYGTRRRAAGSTGARGGSGPAVPQGTAGASGAPG
ncbi:MAG: respiratory nitrate reductase subunit gamma [Thermoanaerobaculia bacterium]